MKNIAIIGAGISGLSVAHFLIENDLLPTIYEKSDQPGGLIKCEVINGVLFHKVGGHVFNTKNKEISNWFWNKFDKGKEFLGAKRNAKILYDNSIIGYPIENNLFDIDKDITTRIIKDFIQINKSENHSAKNFHDFLFQNFGETLFKMYFEPYNRKVWNEDLKSIPLEWLEGKLPMPNLQEVLLSNIYKEKESKMVHSSFFYPQKNGSQFIANRLAQDLDIKYNNPIRKISNIEKNKWQINDGGIYDKIIYTGDVRKLDSIFSGISLNDKLVAKIKGLRSNGTSNILCEIDSNDLSWLYLPNPNIKAHRIIYTGNFNKWNNGNSKRTTCTIEFSGLHTEETMIEEINKLPGSPIPLAFNCEPNSYIIHHSDTHEIINKVKAILEPKGFYLLGRFAEWEYYNMDNAMEAGLSLSNRIINELS